MNDEVDIRYTEADDAPYLKKWLSDPTTARWWPTLHTDEAELNHAVANWIGFYRHMSSLTTTRKGKPVGIATLCLQPYRKLSHQAEISIVVAPDERNKGIGTDLMRNLIHLAKTAFKLELIHLNVYADNPAAHLYSRFGFKSFGYQEKWIREADGSYTSRTFMELHLNEYHDPKSQNQSHRTNAGEKSPA